MDPRFKRFAALLLVPSLIGADPALAAGFLEILSPSALGAIRAVPIHDAFSAQAIVTPLAGAFLPGKEVIAAGNTAASVKVVQTAERMMQRIRNRFGLVLRTAVADLVLVAVILNPLRYVAAQNQTAVPPAAGHGQVSNPKRPKVPPLSRDAQREAAQEGRLNLSITAEGAQAAWQLDESIPDAIEYDDLWRLTINNNPSVVKTFIDHRVAWEELLAEIAYEGRYFSVTYDKLHGAGPAFVGSQSTIGQTLAYPFVSATSPKHGVVIAEPDQKPDHETVWHKLGRLAGDALRFAVGGIQKYSKNQVELSWLNAHGGSFKVREAYADLEQAAWDSHAAAAKGFLSFGEATLNVEKERRSAWIAYRAALREEQAAAQEGADPETLQSLQEKSQAALARFDLAQSKLDAQRIAIGQQISSSGAKMAGSGNLQPRAPTWLLSPDLLNKAARVPGTLRREGASVAVQTPSPLVSDSALEPLWVSAGQDGLIPVSYPSQEAGGKIGILSGSARPADLDALFEAVDADAPLGTSPIQRKLLLQKELLRTVHKTELEIRKEPTYNIGMHLDLGSQPFLASLLNFDFRKPERSTVISFEDLIIATELRMQGIDRDLAKEEIRLRAEFLEARRQRQEALAKLVATRNRIALEQARLQTAQATDTQWVAADRVTPLLRIQEFEAEYALHLAEAWSAWQVMQLYTPEGQQRVVEEVAAHYVGAMKRIDPSFNISPATINPPVWTPKVSQEKPKTQGRYAAPAGYGREISINREPPIIEGASAAQPVSLEEKPEESWQEARQGGGGFKKAAKAAIAAAGAVFPFAAASAHTFSPVAPAAQFASHVAQGGAIGQAVQQVAMDVTLGDYTGGAENTLSGIARDILQAQNPGHHVSYGNIDRLAHQIAHQNGIANPNIVPAGKLLQIGTFDSETANRMQQHPGGYVAVHSHPAATTVDPDVPLWSQPAHPSRVDSNLPPMMDSHHPLAVSNPGHTAQPDPTLLNHASPAAAGPAQIPPQDVGAAAGNHVAHLPKPPLVNDHAGQAHHTTGSFFDGLSSVGHHIAQYVGSSPEHLVLAVGAAILAGLLIYWMAHNFVAYRRAVQGQSPTVFHGLGHQTRSPQMRLTSIFFIGGSTAAIMTKIGLVASFAVTFFQVPWIAAISLFLLIPVVLSLMPRSRFTPTARFISLAVISLVWLGLGFSIWIRILGIGATLLSPYVAKGLRRHRGIAIFLTPIVLIGVWLGVVQGAPARALVDRVGNVATHRIDLIRNADLLAPNYGVSVGKVRLPVRVTPPAAYGGVVHVADPSRTKVHKGEIVWAVGPLDPGLRALLEKAISDDSLISANRITEVSQPRGLVWVEPTVDQNADEIRRLTLETVSLQESLGIAQAISRANAAATGTTGDSFQVRYLRFKIHELGRRINAKLLERAEIAVPASRDLSIVSDSMIAGGKVLVAGTPTPLFVEEVAQDVVIQLKLHRDDALRLRLQQARDPQGTALLIKDSNGTEVPIPFKEIRDQLTENDPSFFEITHNEDFYGQTVTNTEHGVARDFAPVNLVVPSQIGTYQFDSSLSYESNGIFQNGQRVKDEVAGTPGTLSISPAQSSAQPHHGGSRAALVEQVQAEQQLLGELRGMLQELEQHVSLYSERKEVRPLLEKVTVDIADVSTSLTDLQHQIALIDATGTVVTASNAFPLHPYLYSHQALDQSRYSMDPESQTLLPANSPIRLQVSFFVPGGWKDAGSVYVTVPGTDITVPFTTIPANKSQGRVVDFRRIVAEAEVEPQVARQLIVSPGASIVAVQTDPAVRTMEKEPAAVPAQSPKPERPKASGYRINVPGMWLLLLPAAGLSIYVYSLIPLTLVLIFLGWRLVRSGRRNPTASPEIAASNGAPPPLSAEASVPPGEPWEPLTALGDKSQMTFMSGSAMKDLLTALKTTRLESEQIWDRDRGDSMEFLTLKQKLWDVLILGRRKVPLRPYKILLRRWQWDGLTNRMALLLDRRYRIDAREAKAASKAHTFRYVILFGAAAAFYFAFIASPPQLREGAFFLRMNPMLQYVTSNPLLGAFTIFLSIFVAGWIIIGGWEAWGKVFSNTPVNLSRLNLWIQEQVHSNPQDSLKRIPRSMIEKLKEIDEAEPLFQSYDDGSPYQTFLGLLDEFASTIRERARRRLMRNYDFEHPSAEALAFDNAFRIQVRRAQPIRSAIYRGAPPHLAADEELINHLRSNTLYRDIDVVAPARRYHLLECARVEETLKLMQKKRYSMDTLMALLRAGSVYTLAELSDAKSLKGGDRHQVAAILNALKEDRLNSLDPDVFDDSRAQERLTTFFDVIHWIFRGLKRPYEPGERTSDDARNRQSNLLAWLRKSVRVPEYETWKKMLARLQDFLDNKEGTALAKTPDEIDRDELSVKNVVYTTAVRALKNDEQGSRRLLTEEERGGPPMPEVSLGDRFLPDETGKPATNALQLDRLYMKHYHLLKEFVARFPGTRILGNRRIAMTCENAATFSHMMREIVLCLRLTDGDIYILNIGGTHDRFAGRLRDAVAERFPWRDQQRIHIVDSPDQVNWWRHPIRMIQSLLAFRVLRGDSGAVILSSAIPLEWQTIRGFKGVRVSGPSPLMKTGLIAGLFNLLDGAELASLFDAAHQELQSHRQKLEARETVLRNSPNVLDSIELEGRAIHLGEEGAKSDANPFRLLIEGRGQASDGRRFESIDLQLERIATETRQIHRDEQALDRLENELHSVPFSFTAAGVTLDTYDSEAKMKLPSPVVDPKAILDPWDPIQEQRLWRLNEAFYLLPTDQPVSKGGTLFVQALQAVKAMRAAKQSSGNRSMRAAA